MAKVSGGVAVMARSGTTILCQPRDLGDVHLEQPRGHIPGAARPTAQVIKGGIVSGAAERVQGSAQGERCRKEPPQDKQHPGADADAGHDDEDHVGFSIDPKSRGIAWGRERRLIVAKPTANSPAIRSRTIWPIVLEKGLK